MKIAILTQYYPPEIGAPQNRLASLTKRLRERGHDVTILTAMPNYPRGKIYPGYGGFFKKENENRITVLRAWIYPIKSVEKLARLAHYFSFVLSSFFVGIFFLPKVDFLITESPPLFLGITGYILSRLKRAKWIFNVSDLWPQSVVSLGVFNEGWVLSLAWKLEAFCYCKATLVSCQSLEIQKNIQSRFPNVPTFHFSNGVEIEQFTSSKVPAIHSSSELCVAAYIGLHGLAQGLEQILEAAETLKGSPLRIDFIGDGPEKEKLIRLAHEKNLSSVHFLDPISHEEVIKYLSAADIAIVSLRAPIPGAVPSKLYEAMAAEKPILLIAAGEVADIVCRYQCGIVVPPGDAAGIAKALKDLSEDSNLRNRLGKAGREAAINFFDRSEIERQFISKIEKIRE